MLTSFQIRNFRLFKKTDVKHLSLVNLFVGKNNSGKSALLEALQVYASDASFDILHELVVARDGIWESEINATTLDSSERIENPLRSLFYGQHIPVLGERGIEIGPIGQPEKLIKIRQQAYQIRTDDGIRRRLPVAPEQLAANNIVDVELGLEVSEGDREWFLTQAEVEKRQVRRPRYLGANREPKYQFQVVPANRISDAKLAPLWDKIHLTDVEKEIIDCLKLIQPKISGLAFIGESDVRVGLSQRSRRIPVIRTDDSQERFSLKSMGDGLTRLLEIALALVNSKDGFLLIDEFENGLHWTVHPQVWSLIFRLSHILNVQVFATTHSQDCIRGFYSAWLRSIDSGTFHRLEIDEERGVRSTEYDFETLADSLETKVEVR